MRTITLLAVSILLTASVANANETKSFNTVDFATNRFDFDEPISFTERGIEFFVFPNGDFDFNTRPDDSEGGFFYRKAGVKTTERRGTPTNYGVKIEHDSFGRVRRVGNTFINYDSRDRVSRIGTVYMKYNRFALTQIGGMKLVYNRFGEITDMIGSVKGRNNSGFTHSYYTNNHQTYTYNNDDHNYYYYRTDGTKALVEDKE